MSYDFFVEFNIIIDTEDLLKVNDFCVNGIEAKFTTGSNSPYAITRKTIKIDGQSKRKQYYIHRLVMDVLYSPKIFIDHINGNTLDNRKDNLRPVTTSQNMKNRKPSKIGTSIYLGVHYCKNKRGSKKWRALIKPYQERNIHLGYYYTEEEAAYAYNLAAKEIHKQYANLNVIELKKNIDIIHNKVNKYIQEYNDKNKPMNNVIVL
jgi:hypothetical protein